MKFPRTQHEFLSVDVVSSSCTYSDLELQLHLRHFSISISPDLDMNGSVLRNGLLNKRAMIHMDVRITVI